VGGIIQGYWEEIQAQPTPGTISEAGLGPANTSKRLAARFYQLKAGHCLTGNTSRGRRSSPPLSTGDAFTGPETLEHPFKCCPRWKRQQEILWAEVRRETGKGKGLFKIRDHFADERCSQAILDLLATTDVGKLAPKPAEEDV